MSVDYTNFGIWNHTYFDNCFDTPQTFAIGFPIRTFEQLNRSQRMCNKQLCCEHSSQSDLLPPPPPKSRAQPPFQRENAEVTCYPPKCIFPIFRHPEGPEKQSGRPFGMRPKPPSAPAAKSRWAPYPIPAGSGILIHTKWKLSAFPVYPERSILYNCGDITERSVSGTPTAGSLKTPSWPGEWKEPPQYAYWMKALANGYRLDHPCKATPPAARTTEERVILAPWSPDLDPFGLSSGGLPENGDN